MLGGPLGVMIGTYAGQKIGGYVGGLVDDFKKAQNAEEVGKIVGRELNKLSKILPGGEFLSQYAEAAAEKLGIKSYSTPSHTFFLYLPTFYVRELYGILYYMF